MDLLLVIFTFIGIAIVTLIIQRVFDIYIFNNLYTWFIKILLLFRVKRTQKWINKKQIITDISPISDFLHLPEVGEDQKPVNDLNFQNFLETVYILLRLDQIEETEGYAKSSVNTFYRLLGLKDTDVTELMRREGGITCTCVTIESLISFWKPNIYKEQTFIHKVLLFLQERQVKGNGGLGVKQFDRLMEIEIHPTFRHTSQVVATLINLNMEKSFDILYNALNYIHSLSFEQTKNHLLNDSWSVAGIVAFMRAHDQLLKNLSNIPVKYLPKSSIKRILYWRKERDEWIKILINMGNNQDSTTIWYPEWAPPKKCKNLWFQSFVTVIRQVPDLAINKLSSDRIHATILNTISKVGTKGLCLGANQIPDITATTALLEILLLPEVVILEKKYNSNWSQVRINLFNIILKEYKNPSYYNYFWGELVAPILKFLSDDSLYKESEKELRLKHVEEVIMAIELKNKSKLEPNFAHIIDIITSINKNSYVKFKNVL